MSDKEYAKMTVALLKEELKRRGLEQIGKKADLVSRLEAHDLSLKNDVAEEESIPPEKQDVQENDVLLDKMECDELQETSNMEDKGIPAEDVSVPESEEKNDVEASHPEAEKQHDDVMDLGIKSSHIDDDKEVEPVEEQKARDEEFDKTTESNVCEHDDDPTSREQLPEETKEIQNEPEATVHLGVDSVDVTSGSSDVNSNNEGEKHCVSSPDDDFRICNLFGIEMKRERDAFQLKWHGNKFTVPFIGEIVKDLAAEVYERSFIVRSVILEDIQSSCFQEIICCVAKFLIDFQENVLESSQPGFVKFVCKNNEDSIKFKESLRIYKADLTIENISFDDQLAQQFLNRDVTYYKGTIVDRLLYVGNLPCDVAECSVRDLFPDALRVIIPPLKEIDKSINTARYVYVEYPSADDVVAVAEKCKELMFNEEKLFIIKALCMKKERFGLLTDTLRTILLDKVRKMRKIQKNPWNKSRQEMQEIEKTISLNMEKLLTDSKHRRNWNMELGALDENRLEQDDPERIDSISERGRGGHRGGSTRGNVSRGSFDSRRGHMSTQRYSGFNNYNSRGGGGGWSGGGSGSFYGSSGYSNYSQSGGYGSQDSYFTKRKSSDSYGGDWKRGRHY